MRRITSGVRREEVLFREMKKGVFPVSLREKMKVDRVTSVDDIQTRRSTDVRKSSAQFRGSREAI